MIWGVAQTPLAVWRTASEPSPLYSPLDPMSADLSIWEKVFSHPEELIPSFRLSPE